MVEALGPSVAYRAVGEEEGVSSSARIQNSYFAAHVEQGLLLANKAGVEEVLSSGA